MSARVRSTSNVAITFATWTTTWTSGCRRNTSSKKSTTRALASKRKNNPKGDANANTTKRKTGFIGTGRSAAVGNSEDLTRARRALQLYAGSRFLEIPHIQ